MSLSKPVLTTQIVQDINGKKFVTSDQPAGSFGLGIGYVALPIRKLGWMSEASAISFSYGQSQDVQYLVRVAGNVATALNDTVYFKSGLNLSQTLGERVLNGVSTRARAGLGFQAGAGFQFHPGAGAEVSYVWLAQPHDAGGEILAQGLEFGLTGNF